MNVLEHKAAQLRQAFDLSFAQAPRTQVTQFEDFLILTADGNPYALRRADITVLARGTAITPLPGSGVGFIGLVGLRGAAVPLYDLPFLLGCAPAGTPCRWVAGIAAGKLMLGFDHLQGYLRIPATQIVTEDHEQKSRRHVAAVIRVQDNMQHETQHSLQHTTQNAMPDLSANQVYPVVDTASILETLRQQHTRRSATIEESS